MEQSDEFGHFRRNVQDVSDILMPFHDSSRTRTLPKTEEKQDKFKKTKVFLVILNLILHVLRQTITDG